MMADPFANVVSALQSRGVRFVITGVWGANYFAGGQLFVTQDQDLFLPEEASNLLAAWVALTDLGLELFANDEPLDFPRDLDLANAVVASRSLTCATDHELLRIDLSMVMSGHEFASVWSRRKSFLVEGVTMPVADLADIVTAKRNANRPKDRMFLATHAEMLRRLLGS
jgi:predicted nucleotidyltransferase